MGYSLRLLSYNAYDDKVNNDDKDDKDDSVNESYELNYKVQMFGINEKGETYCLYVNGFKPYFYIKVDEKWNNNTLFSFVSHLKDMSIIIKNDLYSAKFVRKKKLYGFDCGNKYKFVLLESNSEKCFKKIKNLWYSSNNPTNEYKLKDNGYKYNGKQIYLYESNIPPLLRLFHLKDINPSGWISVLKNKISINTLKKTNCNYEYNVNYKYIIPLKNKEISVPYKICSFDIEASSSHGDFPLAIKNYKKLAVNILDLWMEYNENEEKNNDYIKDIILSAFDLYEEGIENVDIVYPKTKVKCEEIEEKIDKYLLKNLSDFKLTNNEKDICGLNDDEIVENKVWCKFILSKKKDKGKDKIIDLMNDNKLSRDVKITILTKTLDNEFPKLEGDKITFIGSTFLKYGEDKPYKNNCIVLNSCNNLEQLENSEIETCESEKEVLLKWTELIQKENPDIIIGYNIFGFDYQFMYIRSKELNCVYEFLKLSRNKEEICIKKDWKTNKNGLEESKIVIASGQHDLKYINMKGRLQIDLYNYFRKDFNLIKYKLDYVSSYFIGDYIKKIEHVDNTTKIYCNNFIGLEENNFITMNEEGHSIDFYKDGDKFEVINIEKEKGYFVISGIEEPNMNKKVKWGLAKDDVSPQDIFRLSNEGPIERAIIAKYCIQDCNLVHNLMKKLDVMTGYIEMSNLCSVPLNYLVIRGQGIKLTSFISKKCLERDTLMPVIPKGSMNDGYEGAIVLEPKCNLYLEDPVACVDFGSLYPSSMISENISHDSKVMTKEYDLKNNLLVETGEKDEEGNYIYDNLEGYKYVDIKYDTYSYRRKNNNINSALEKVKVGYKICRFAQFPNGEMGIIPSILKELLSARKATRKLISIEKDQFMKNILDKRQLSIKVTANSMYGQTGAKTSTFYDVDCAASTTAIGRKLLIYAKNVIEGAYNNIEVETIRSGIVKTKAEYIYGDTDSVFFKFNLRRLNGTPIKGQEALEITIKLAQQAGVLATKFLKKPHDLEYEKTFLPFCLLSKKRYVGMLYELDPTKCKRKSMGIVLKRRDNAPIVKDIYGGIIDILMKDKNVEKAAIFLKSCLKNIIEEKYSMDKLIITKSLRGYYKNPKQIAHKVLADRIGKRDPGNKPNIGERIPFVYIVNNNKKALQGNKIENPNYIIKNKLKIDYSFYITNQVMKPVQQIFSIVLEQLKDFKKKKGLSLRSWKSELKNLKNKYPSIYEYRKKEETLRNKEVKSILFDSYLRQSNNKKNGLSSIKNFYKVV